MTGKTLFVRAKKEGIREDMAQHFKRLEYNCKCIHISIGYARGSMIWPDTASEFEVVDDKTTQVGHYRTWADNIDPDSLRQVRKEIEQRVESFVLAMRFIGNVGFLTTDEIYTYITESGEEHQIINDIDIEAIIRHSKGEESICCSGILPTRTLCGSMSSDPAPLPQSMPSVPLTLKNHILNALHAEALDSGPQHYEDEQLKLWFFIIEDLEVDTSRQEYIDLKLARDFISHSKIDRKKGSSLFQVGKSNFSFPASR
jgi:hypothetical protein